MGEEIQELERHNTWMEVQRSSIPEGANILPSTWAYKVKRYPDGRLRKFKARFVARGDRQVEGVDYFEKYAPVVSWSTVRLVLIMAIHLGWATRQIDFSNAFVQADLKEEVYLSLPPGFVGEDGSRKNMVLKLNKSLYGLVQAPLVWGNHLSEKLLKLGFKQGENDPCIYFGKGMLILVYVDDVLVFGPSQEHIDDMLGNLKNSKMEFSVEEDVYAFLGVELKRNEATGEVTLLQKGLIDKVLKTLGMEDANGKSTPAEMVPLGTDAEGPIFSETWNYASVIGMLMYLASNSRPDIQFAVHECARFTHTPKRSHGDAIKRIGRYLIQTKDKGMIFKPNTEFKLDCYCDADYAGLWRYEEDQDPVCVKSRTGYVITLGGCPMTWASKLQMEIALSTLEAEYIALSQSMRELVPLRNTLLEIGRELHMSFAEPMCIHSTIFEDNNGAIGLATAPKMTPRTKHIGIKYHWFRSYIGKEKGYVLKKIESENQKADLFTKGLSEELLKRI